MQFKPCHWCIYIGLAHYYPEHAQKILLIDALGDKSPLVAAIMEHIKVSAGGPGSYVDQALNCELPPSTQLNHAIMERIKVSAGGPGSYVDQALNCELPPSTQLNHADVVAVLNAILGQKFMDLRGLCNYFDTQLSTSTSSTSTSSISSEVSSEAFRAYYEYTLYLGNKEASARGILALFMDLVRDALQKRHPNQKFYVDHELQVL